MKKEVVVSLLLFVSTVSYTQISTFGLECTKATYNRQTGEKKSSRNENAKSSFDISTKEIKTVIDNVTTIYQVIKDPIYRRSANGNSVILQCKQSDGAGFAIGVHEYDNDNDDEIFIIPDFTESDSEYYVTTYYVFPLKISDLKVAEKGNVSSAVSKEISTMTVETHANVSTEKTVYIPDAYFKAKLIALGLDLNRDGQIQFSEVKEVKTLVVSNSSITDLTGIEAFSALKTLVCVENKLTSLDISKNQTLAKLYCGLNKITAIDLSHNKALKEFSCYKCNLSELDLTNNPAIETVLCSGNLKLKNICVTKAHLATKNSNQGIWEKDAGAVWSTTCANRK